MGILYFLMGNEVMQRRNKIVNWLGGRYDRTKLLQITENTLITSLVTSPIVAAYAARCLRFRWAFPLSIMYAWTSISAVALVADAARTKVDK